MSSRKELSHGQPGPPGLARWAAHPAMLALLLVAATLAIYWPVVSFDFVHLDDPVYVSENPQVLGGLSWANVRWAFSTVEGGSWHPLTWLSLLLDGQFFGRKPGGYHAVNVLLHGINTLLLFGLLRQMTGAVWRSAAVAALFALHPLHVESVAWISERKDVLSTAFWLLTLWAYAQYAARRGLAGDQAGRPAVGAGRWYVATFGLFVLGLMSKPMLVTVPFVMLLLDYWPLARFGRRPSGCPTGSPDRVAPVSQLGYGFSLSALPGLLWEKMPFFALSAVASAVTIWAQQKSEAVVSLQSMSLTWRGVNAVVAYARYLGKTFWPVDLAVFYPHQQTWDVLLVVVAGALLVGLSVLMLRFGRRCPYLITGGFWFVGTLVPVIGLVQVGAQSMADRYTYVPLIGLFIALVWGAGALATTWPEGSGLRRAVGLAAGLVLMACALRTAGQLRYWQNSETLFRHALAVTQQNAVAHGSLGSFLVAQGRFEEAAEQSRLSLAINPESTEALNNLGLACAGLGRWDEAVASHRAALRLKPADASALNSLGLALANQGKLAEAVEQFHASLKVRPDSPDVLNNLGLALACQGRTDEAIEHYHRVLKIKPDSDRALNNLGLALASQQRLSEAVRAYQRALAVNPDYTDARVNLGAALAASGQVDEAIRLYHEALARRPDHPEALNNLGLIQADRGQLEEAVSCFRRVLQLRPNHPQVLNNLGVALARLGRAEEAIASFNTALQAHPGFPDAHLGLSRLLAQQGQRDEAIQHAKEALRLRPEDSAAQEQLRLLGVPAP
jgi:Flp pilus assembly protein TadD